MRLPRRPRLIVPVMIALAAIVVLILIFTGLYTEYLWYDSVDLTSVFSTMLVTQGVLFVVGALLMTGIVAGNTLLAYRVRPMFGPSVLGAPHGADRYRQSLDPHRRLVFLIAMGGLALFTGSWAAGQWKTWLEFANATRFGDRDPQFRLDVSFFMFTVPFLRQVLTFLFTAVILSIVVSAIVHYLYGGFRILNPGGVRATRAARVHLSVLLGVFLLLKAAAYALDRYELVFSHRGFVHGASYTDVNAVLPAKGILAVIAVICAAIFFAGVVRPGGMWPGVAFGLMVLSAVLIGGVYPALVDQFQVRPNQQAKEEPYIARNIEATRKAYGVADTVIESYPGEGNPEAAQVARDKSVSGVRLLDPALVAKTFQQEQRIRGFYDFPTSLDVDRYRDADGTVRDHIVAVREITGPPQEYNNWINRHLVYTHGYGFVAAPGNRVTSDGLPDFDAKNMPVEGPLVTTTGLKEPRVYFGERSLDYVIVGGKPDKPQELDYPGNDQTGQANTNYTGKGGVPVGSFINRFFYAIRYGEMNLLLSRDITDKSRILYHRHPAQRVAKVAPFLTLDSDPYPAIVDGRIVWIIDAYTTSNQYPYSQSRSLSDMIRDTSTDLRAITAQPRDYINYIRNSVKATVDAYDGTVTLYEWDADDPVLKTWKKVFPGLIKPRSEMSAQLLEHVRYPLDLFKVQRDILSRYHITDARSFYNGQDFWNVPDDPSSGERNIKQPPYYLSITMPGASEPTFSLTTTFVPRQRAANLAAFMSGDVSSGPPGKLRILRIPASTKIAGPGQVQNTFTNRFAGELNILGLGKAQILYGNLLTLPFAGGLLYVEPVYVQAPAGAGQEPYPILRRVLVMYGNKVGSADTLEEALTQIFGDTGQVQRPAEEQREQQEQEQRELSGSLASLIEKAQKAYADAQAALEANPVDWAKYGEAQKALKEALDELGRARAALPTAQPTVPPTAEPTPEATPAPSPSPTG